MLLVFLSLVSTCFSDSPNDALSIDEFLSHLDDDEELLQLLVDETRARPKNENYVVDTVSKYNDQEFKVWAQPPCKTVGATCSTCTSVNICVAANGSSMVVNCDRPTPYCNAGSCSAVPGTRECTDKLAKFTCPEEDGTYPDGSSCRKYHSCLNGTSHDYDCTVSNSVYSASTESCVRMSLLRPCHTVRCSRESKFVTYPGDNSIYFLCVNSRPTLVQRCPNGFQFDQSAQKCVVACTKEGRLPDPAGNLTYFLECTLLPGSVNTFTTITRPCPEKSILNVTNLRCSLT